MTQKTTPSPIQQAVMAKIHDGSVRMRPRVFFTLLWLLGIVASVTASLTLAYVISIIVYIIRIQTAGTPAYGARQNLSEALAHFPWWAVVASVVFSIAAIYLMGRYSRLYRYKTRNLVLFFMAITITLSFLLSISNIGHPSRDSMQSMSGNGAHTRDGSGRGFNRDK